MKRFQLLSNYVSIIFPAITANGFVYTVRLRKDRSMADSSVGEYALIVCITKDCIGTAAGCHYLIGCGSNKDNTFTQ